MKKWDRQKELTLLAFLGQVIDPLYPSAVTIPSSLHDRHTVSIGIIEKSELGNINLRFIITTEFENMPFNAPSNTLEVQYLAKQRKVKA